MLKGAQASANASVQMTDLMSYVDGKLKTLRPKPAAVEAPASPPA
jgi:hypothetical protein